MKKHNLILLCTILFLNGLAIHSNAHKRTILIIETGSNDVDNFKKTLATLKASGNDPLFKQAYNVTPADIANHDTILLLLDHSFYSATSKNLIEKNKIDSPMLKHLYILIEQLKKKKNSTIGLALPVVGNPVLIASITERLLEKLDVLENRTTESARSISCFIQHLIKSNASKSVHYRTALFDKRTSAQISAKDPMKLQNCNHISADFLPKIREISPQLTPLHPLGIKIKNNKSGNTFFLTNLDTLNAQEIKEPFTLTPMDKKLREQLSSQINQTLIQALCRTNINDTPRDSQANEDTSLKKLHPRYAPFKDNRIACAWMNLEPYAQKEDDAIKDISKAGINVMWFELLPEIYLSDRGEQKAKKEAFFRALSKFTLAMRHKKEFDGQPLPHFFMGANITSNLRHHIQRDPACDIYGTCYDHIPSPLDIDHFWEPEFLVVFDRFVDEWVKKVGNGIPLAGIFLDLEMYHAQNETGQFLATMDFSNTAWRLYLKKHPLPQGGELKTVDERVRFLMETHRMDDYFATLREEATKIGVMVRSHIKRKLPNALIGIYNINLPNNWFYQGFARGLSTPEEPIICATFNTEFNQHKRELEKKGIYLLHMPVLLLSKLKKVDDFKLINEILSEHDGIWFNRFSRLAQERDPENKIWYHLETTNLDTKTVIENIAQSLQKDR